MSLGVHFALVDDDLERLLSIDDDDELVDFIVEDLEERYLADDRWSYQSDKAWDAIHRCLGDGTLLYATGPHPLTYAVLGGRALDAGEDYTACLVEAPNVRETSRALERVTREWLRQRYDTLSNTDYGQPLSDEDFEYTWENFVGLRDFFARAAEASRAVLFTTDA
jgi:hypothetical protein